MIAFRPKRWSSATSLSAAVRGLLIFFVFVAGDGGGSPGVGLVADEETRGRTTRRRNTPRSVLREDQTPPAPQLQPSVGHDATVDEDLTALRRRENEVFAKLGWVVHPGVSDAEIPPEIVRRVAEEQHARATAAFVPPTTTGRNSNSIVPATNPAGDIRPTEQGGTP